MKALLFAFLLSVNSYGGDLDPAEPEGADLPFRDGDFACTTQADASRYTSDFGIDEQSFGGRELCNSATDTKKLFNDLSLIEKTEFNADGGHSFVRGFVPLRNYYSWMKGETRGMNRADDIPWATAYNAGGYFTMQDGWAALSTLGRVGTVIHEARHTAGYRHYACSSGPYGGSSSSGCDTSYNQGGSHAVEMEYYARVVLQAKNLHPAYKSMARLMLLGRSNFVFNEKPMRTREGLLARAGGRLILVDGQNKPVDREIPAAEAGAVLKRTSFGASLVKGYKAVAVDVYGFSNNGYAMEDDYSYYKLYKTPRAGGPQSVQDVEEIDIGTRRYMAYLADGGKVYSYNFPAGAWHPASGALSGAQAFVTVAPSGERGLFAVKGDGAVHPFDLSLRRFGNALGTRWPADTRAYAYLGQNLLRLGVDGQVRTTSGEPVDAFRGLNVSELVNIPLYDAFEVAP